MSLNEGSRTLVIFYKGYGTQSMEFTESTNYEVRLQPSANVMKDVVVIGYGTQKKSHLTGAITKVRTEKIDEAPVSRIDQALQGKVAGVQIQNITSEAGSDPKIRVRG